MTIRSQFIAVLLATLACSSALATPALDQEIAALARESDTAKFDIPDGEPRAKAFEAVRQHAVNVARQYPNRSEPLVWQAWALIDQSVALKDFSSLGLLKQAKKQLEAALDIDPNNTDAMSSLGSLYFNVPKWPLSFGDRKKGRNYLLKALAINPKSDWQNLDYAKCLIKDEDYSGAVKHATITLSAPMRPGNKRDANLRIEAEALLANAKEKIR